jgi:hypothetical protein
MRCHAIAAVLSLGLSGCSYFFPSCQTIPPCPAGEVLCTQASCTDLSVDPLNCGACENVCGPGLVCIPGADGGGSCGCSVNLLLFNGQCLDLATDSHNCGSVGTSCQDGEYCLAGQCGCLGADAGVNLETDELNCGSCSVACAATAACQSGSCICQDGTTQCGSVCCGTAGPCQAGVCAGASDGGADGGVDGGLGDAGDAG